MECLGSPWKTDSQNRLKGYSGCLRSSFFMLLTTLIFLAIYSSYIHLIPSLVCTWISYDLTKCQLPLARARLILTLTLLSSSSTSRSCLPALKTSSHNLRDTAYIRCIRSMLLTDSPTAAMTDFCIDGKLILDEQETSNAMTLGGFFSLFYTW